MQSPPQDLRKLLNRVVWLLVDRRYHSADYSYAFLILIVSLYLICQKRHALFHTQVQGVGGTSSAHCSGRSSIHWRTIWRACCDANRVMGDDRRGYGLFSTGRPISVGKDVSYFRRRITRPSSRGFLQELFLTN